MPKQKRNKGTKTRKQRARLAERIRRAQRRMDRISMNLMRKAQAERAIQEQIEDANIYVK